MSAVVHNFLDFAQIKCVVHNGTCWAACIANALQLGDNGIVRVAEMTIAMLDDPLLPRVVREWIVLFKTEFEAFCAAPSNKKDMHDEAYVTTPALQAYANRYGTSFIMTTVLESGRTRRNVNIVDVIIPTRGADDSQAVVFRCSGHRFDYYVPRKGKETQFNDFIAATIKVNKMC